MKLNLKTVVNHENKFVWEPYEDEQFIADIPLLLADNDDAERLVARVRDEVCSASEYGEKLVGLDNLRIVDVEVVVHVEKKGGEGNG